jgi:ribosomal protein S18 acetylase RimI-like enzyme
MNLKSLGYRTDLIFPAFDGEIIDRDSYLVVRTPENPSFYWGNFLLFPYPPKEDDFAKWSQLFTQEIGVHEKIKHQAFGWDSTEGDEGIVQSFFDAGFNLSRNIVMTSQGACAPSRVSEDVEIRVLSSDSDWKQAVENQVICREPEFDEAEHKLFRQLQMSRYRKMVKAGLGEWYGAFHGNHLVADLGIFHIDGVGRFQSIETHPDFRQRGIGTALIVKSAHHSLEAFNLRKLVIVAEDSSKPQQLYESLGFKPVESQVGLARWPQTDGAGIAL